MLQRLSERRIFFAAHIAICARTQIAKLDVHDPNTPKLRHPIVTGFAHAADLPVQSPVSI